MEIVLFGASVRSLAFSVLAAGDQPIAVDLFADWDLRRRCPAHCIPWKDYPAGFRRFAVEIRGRSWMYAGGLENHPALIDELSRSGPLWGNRGDCLRGVRDPMRLAAAFRTAGFAPPNISESSEGIPTDGSWLVKPLGGAGGRGVRNWRGGAAPRDSYWQELVFGESFGAIFVGEGGTASLLGVTRQWVGKVECHAAPFAYSGSVGPWPAGPGAIEVLTLLGNVLASSFGLRGLFGVDYVEDRGVVRPIEVNPRFTASIEVLEHGLGVNAYRMHRGVFVEEAPPEHPSRPTHAFVAKAILFASRVGRVSPDAVCYRRNHPEQGNCWFADVPVPGSEFLPGDPILTVLAGGTSLADAESRLWESMRSFEYDGLEY